MGMLKPGPGQPLEKTNLVGPSSQLYSSLLGNLGNVGLGDTDRPGFLTQ